MARSSWRITVRQLESMIRLSEAMARMSCSEEVLPRHVQEAFRLLNKSIIRVETPDIDFEADAQVLADVEEDGDGMFNGDGGAPTTNGFGGEKKVSMSKVRVTYEEYKKIANLLILHLRQMEEGGNGMYLSVCDKCGIVVIFDQEKEQDVVNWLIGIWRK